LRVIFYQRSIGEYMSQVTFRTTYNGKQAEVMAGWDNPLRYYHLTVFNLEAGDDEEECFWSGLDGDNPFSVKTVGPLKEKLAELGIEAPAGFWERVEPKLGNVFVRYVDGEWQTS
jgi:hypothetical protein